MPSSSPSPLSQATSRKKSETKSRKGLAPLLDPAYLSFKADERLDRAVRAMRQNDQSAAVIVNSDNQCEGLITEREICRFLLDSERMNTGNGSPIVSYHTFRLEDAMIADPVCLEAGISPTKALETMREQGYSFMPVVKGNQVAGIIDIKTLLLHLHDLKSENQEPSKSEVLQHNLLHNFRKKRQSGSTIKILGRPVNTR